MSNEIQKASAEVTEILKHLPEDMTDKLPQDFTKMLKKISAKDHKIYIDDAKSLLEQGVSKETINLLIILYRNFWCDEEERKRLDKMLIDNEKKMKK